MRPIPLLAADQESHTRLPLDQAAVLASLRARVARLEGGGRSQDEAAAIPVCEGSPLPGLARGAVHEVLATASGCGAAFCAVLLARTGGTVFWIMAGRDGLLAWPEGLAPFGLDPARLILVRAERWTDALWAMEEVLRCQAVTGALLAVGRDLAGDDARLDLTATRRLQLAAEAGGALGLLLRHETTAAGQTACTSRWRIGPLGERNGLEDPCWQLELLHLRGGRPGGPWAMTWHAATARLELLRRDREGHAPFPPRTGREASA